MASRRLNILAFSFFPAIVPPTSGGEKRLYELYSALSQHHSVRLISSSWSDRPTSVLRHTTTFREFQVQKNRHFTEIYAELRQLSASRADLSGPAVYLAGAYPNETHQIYYEQYRNADVIIHDSPFTINFDVMAGMDLKPRVYNSYNCETALYSKMHPGGQAKRIRDVVKEAEVRMLQVSDLIATCSHEDDALLKHIAGRQIPNIIVPNGGLVRAHSDAQFENDGTSTIFIGSQHQPNVEAAEFIVSTLAPALPEITFHITGNCLPAGDYPKNVKCHGFVSEETKDELLKSCDIALNPMFSGSGSNLKFTEYLSYSLPVVSTAFGARGLGLAAGIDYIEAGRDNFAIALATAQHDRGKLKEVAHAGHAKFNQTLTWPTIAAGFSNELSSLIDQRKTYPAPPALALNDYDFTVTQSGGAARIRGLYEQLRLERQIYYVVMTDDLTWSTDTSIPGITVLRVPKTAEHRAEQRRVDGQHYVSAADIVSLYMLSSNRFLCDVLKLLKSICGCVITDHIYTSDLVSTQDRWIYSSHNYETRLKIEALSHHPLRESLVEKVRKAEERAMREAVAVICVSKSDAELMVAGRKSSVPTIVIPNGVLPATRTNASIIQTKDITIGTHSCIFIGSAHMPNVEACTFLIEQLADALSEIEFHIVGSVCDTLRGRKPPNVHLWGTVSESLKAALVGAAKVALNPVQIGGGSNVKLADYLSFGLPIISTPFGARGFPAEVVSEITICERKDFARAIQHELSKPSNVELQNFRKSIYEKHLNASTLSKALAKLVAGLPVKKKRILVVTYRLTYPTRGGAEAYLMQLISFLATTNRYDIDIVAPDLDIIGEESRFAGTFAPELMSSGPYDFPNVHWCRFPMEENPPSDRNEKLIRLWESQAAFERAVATDLKFNCGPLLLWGWTPSSTHGADAGWWAASEAAIFSQNRARLRISGFAQGTAVISSGSGSSTILSSQSLNGSFEFEINLNPGVFTFRVTSSVISQRDPRPLGLFVSSVSIDDTPLQMYQVNNQLHASPEEAFRVFDRAANVERYGCSLSEVRGPFSTELENWIESNIAEYDLLITHNNIFRPTTWSVGVAADAGVPTVLLPHAHLDDDFYHFPDVMESVRRATVVLASPSAAVEFFKDINPAVQYHCPGIDLTEIATAKDILDFKNLHNAERPYLLILGRKASSKNYNWIIEAACGSGVDVVIIGPDDDGLPVNTPNVIYLGQQPRSVVRGALASCIFLVNMSSSESFGIVLLEAWLNKRPVIANTDCAAFRDLVTHGKTGLLVEKKGLGLAIRTLVSDSSLRSQLGAAGYEQAMEYGWEDISRSFEDICVAAMNKVDSKLL